MSKKKQEERKSSFSFFNLLVGTAAVLGGARLPTAGAQVTGLVNCSFDSPLGYGLVSNTSYSGIPLIPIESEPGVETSRRGELTLSTVHNPSMLEGITGLDLSYFGSDFNITKCKEDVLKNVITEVKAKSPELKEAKYNGSCPAVTSPMLEDDGSLSRIVVSMPIAVFNAMPQSVMDFIMGDIESGFRACQEEAIQKRNAGIFAQGESKSNSSAWNSSDPSSAYSAGQASGITLGIEQNNESAWDTDNPSSAYSVGKKDGIESTKGGSPVVTNDGMIAFSVGAGSVLLLSSLCCTSKKVRTTVGDFLSPPIPINREQGGAGGQGGDIQMDNFLQPRRGLIAPGGGHVEFHAAGEGAGGRVRGDSQRRQNIVVDVPRQGSIAGLELEDAAHEIGQGARD